VRYPDAGVVTADELHIPVGVPVELTLRTADVIHSFWLPQLNGKTDLIPGQENHMYIEASEPGTFRGECAEFCGQQHANMAFSVVAESRGAYDAWAAREQGEAHPPLDSVQAAGMLAFTSHACAYCHTIRGTSAGGRVGPDLTHVGSRATLAGGMLANTPAALGGWIENPDRLKPGTRMPAVPLDGASVNAIVQYLESLK
jgi:cytochrome c oxidase subunit 2